jgi:ABC transporter substrate binding protein (PQQ-dependent alcohol dehydrogenase system)
VILPEVPADAEPWQREVAEQAEHGAIQGFEEHLFNAQLLGIDFDVVFETASGQAGAIAAADRMLEQGVLGIAGGYSVDEAVALGEWAAAKGIPFVNIGVQSDLLRNESCFATTFHVEASAGMYLDALAGWYVRDGRRRWYVVQSEGDEGDLLHERLRWTLQARHFGVSEVGSSVLTRDVGIADILAGFDRANADLLVLLLDPAEQLHLLGQLQAADFAGFVAAYPYPATQTREYFAELLQAAPGIDHYRAVLWEPTLDTSGAIEFNLRYRQRWNGETMDGPAWAAFHAIKILFDSVSFGGANDPAGVVDYMESPNAVFDLHKLLGASFRPWDHQLRQALYLVRVDPDAESVFRAGFLVGELPALYMPGTDPVERLDQIGDLANRSRCRL